ncbi:hypothetical protein, partial [Hymenobacter glacialis]|uniref:hypothetical protein n=1 Tax=Hymenobacter glacialis TaxID=1908236 RepID=UPI0019D328C1
RDAEEKRMARAIAVRTLLWGTDAPAMDILIRTPAEMERAAGVFQSVETIAEKQGRLLYAA